MFPFVGFRVNGYRLTCPTSAGWVRDLFGTTVPLCACPQSAGHTHGPRLENPLHRPCMSSQGHCPLLFILSWLFPHIQAQGLTPWAPEELLPSCPAPFLAQALGRLTGRGRVSRRKDLRSPPAMSSSRMNRGRACRLTPMQRTMFW